MLINDGTNFNPVAMSGDATIASTGALTIANDAVEVPMLNSTTDPGAGQDGYCLTYADGTTNFEWVDCSVAAGTTTALDDITAADGDNTIASGANNQTWNWALTGAEAGITFGENTASTGGSDDQAIVDIRTLAASTAMPLSISNLGAGLSLVVTDQAADTSPFVIDADGNVGVGVGTPLDPLHIVGGDIRLDGTAANEAGCFRFNDTSDELEYSDDCATFTAFSDIAGSVTAGADTQVIYNASGTLTGEAAFTYNAVTDMLSIVNSTITGDLIIPDDGLFMATTNTAGHMLINDGTNFNPVAMSGDATIASTGALTIAND
ncbi:MAG: hypothetical protein GY945_10345, partial [Rhodobacteraceae bacterium]|nr:hypothetical protein [Paracoccaceae bacterium]